MATARPRSNVELTSAIELLADYAAARGMHQAEEILMELLATAHGWPTGSVLPEAISGASCIPGLHACQAEAGLASPVRPVTVHAPAV